MKLGNFLSHGIMLAALTGSILVFSGCNATHKRDTSKETPNVSTHSFSLGTKCLVNGVVKEVFYDSERNECIKIVCKTSEATTTEHEFIQNDPKLSAGEETKCHAEIVSIREDKIGFKLNDDKIEYGNESDISW